MAARVHSGAVRVVEFAGRGSGIAAAYAGWLLAGMGAQVTRWVDPAGTSGAASQGQALDLALEVLGDGKTPLALPRSAQDVDAQLAQADIFLCDAPAAFAALGGTPQALHARLPRLVAGYASIFGLDQPYADLPATPLDAQALAAVAWSIGDPGREPLTIPPGILEHQAGAMLAAGVLMGLTARSGRGPDGAGELVDIALTDVLASHVAGNSRVFVHHGLQWHRAGNRPFGACGAYPFSILRCRDGQVCISGRTREEWQRLVAAMGHPPWASEPRYQKLRAMGKEYPEEVDALLQPWFMDKTKSELEALALDNNLIVSPLRELHEVLQTPQFHARGHLREREAGGRTVQVPGLPFRATSARSPDAPNFASSLLGTSAVPPAAASADAHRPLAGLRVLDFGWVWSAPWMSTMLGELGAEVIKVEHAARPDNTRLAGRVVRDGEPVEGPSREMSPMYHQINHGKLGITLNTKDPRGLELALRLAAKCDLAVENMSPGALERAGLGYEALKAQNPRIVMLSMSAAGQFGPLADMRVYAPTMSSFVGLEGLVGYPGEEAIGALNFAFGDPSGSLHALSAALAALWRARATGQGCLIDMSQLEALLGTLLPCLLQAQIEGRQPPIQGNRHPGMAPHGIYPAAGKDRWLTIAVADDAQWQDLTRLAGAAAFACDARLATAAGRLAHAAELDAAIAAWTGPQERDALCARLRQAGIASSPVLSLEEQRNHPYFQTRGIQHPVEIPFYGPETLYSAPWRFSGFSARVQRSGPTTGQHNDQVFSQLLELDAAEIQSLKDAGVIA